MTVEGIGVPWVGDRQKSDGVTQEKTPTEKAPRVPSFCLLCRPRCIFCLAYFTTRESEDIYEDTHIINAENSLIYKPANQY